METAAGRGIGEQAISMGEHHHQHLLFAALDMAIITSGFLDNDSLESISLSCRLLLTLVKQRITTLFGDADLIADITQFPSARRLTVSFRHGDFKRKRWIVRKSVASMKLSQLQHLEIRVSRCPGGNPYVREFHSEKKRNQKRNFVYSIHRVNVMKVADPFALVMPHLPPGLQSLSLTRECYSYYYYRENACYTLPGIDNLITRAPLQHLLHLQLHFVTIMVLHEAITAHRFPSLRSLTVTTFSQFDPSSGCDTVPVAGDKVIADDAYELLVAIIQHLRHLTSLVLKPFLGLHRIKDRLVSYLSSSCMGRFTTFSLDYRDALTLCHGLFSMPGSTWETRRFAALVVVTCTTSFKVDIIVGK